MDLGEIIGEGQFGDVHKGTCRVRGGSDGSTIPVAVKTCKADADMATAEKFLEEACKYESVITCSHIRKILLKNNAHMLLEKIQKNTKYGWKVMHTCF